MEFQTERQPLPIVRCQHILCKGMQIFGEDYRTPVDENERTYDFWCEKTRGVLGPDGALVRMSTCTEGRGCYESL